VEKNKILTYSEEVEEAWKKQDLIKLLKTIKEMKMDDAANKVGQIIEKKFESECVNLVDDILEGMDGKG